MCFFYEKMIDIFQIGNQLYLRHIFVFRTIRNLSFMTNDNFNFYSKICCNFFNIDFIFYICFFSVLETSQTLWNLQMFKISTALFYSNFVVQNYNHPFLAHTYFTPVVDGYRMNDSVIPYYPEEMVKKHAHLPVMMGTTTGECTGYVTWLSYLGN